MHSSAFSRVRTRLFSSREGVEMSINMIVALILLILVIGLILYGVVAHGSKLATGILDTLSSLFG
jgi:Flp pilus assembly protein TadG